MQSVKCLPTEETIKLNGIEYIIEIDKQIKNNLDTPTSKNIECIVKVIILLFHIL